MRQATELETSTSKHSVTPGPTLPAHELLGDLLMKQQQPAQALEAYQRSLELYPKRFNSLLGAARATRALQDERVARSYYRELLGVAEGTTRRIALNEARHAVAKQLSPCVGSLSHSHGRQSPTRDADFAFTVPRAFARGNSHRNAKSASRACACRPSAASHEEGWPNANVSRLVMMC
ncbi:MAG TPA: tetratricopeptide repeat protein [Steroidobacteraceae bacterium]